ncbi:hypothetical protein MK079_02995 [Candidatus Gracilibacteria bacterium]|nr:hypothetical protein [Candidatus Gracilibacteria bacterium]
MEQIKGSEEQNNIIDKQLSPEEEDIIEDNILSYLSEDIERDNIPTGAIEQVLIHIGDEYPLSRKEITTYFSQNMAGIQNALNEWKENGQEIQSQVQELESVIGQIDAELSDIEAMFNKNEKEWFDEIEEHEKQDLISFEENAHHLILQFESQLTDMSDLPDDIKQDMQQKINERKKQYLQYTLGIGDKFEGAAKALEETDALKHTQEMLPSMIATMSPEEIIAYVKEIHEIIDDNDAQSDAVKKNYTLFTQQLGQTAYETIKNKGEKNENTKKYLLELAHAITGRGNDIDDDYRDPDLAHIILADLMNDSGGVFEKILAHEQIAITDEKLSGSAMEISQHFTGIEVGGKDFLDMIGFSDVKNITQEYESLSPEQKIKISTLSRIRDQLKKNPELDVAEALQKTTIQMAEELYEPLNDILGHDWHDIVSKDADDYDITGVDADIFNTYQDLNGSGLFDMADTTIGNLKEAGKIGVIIAASIAAGILAAPVAAGVLGSALVVGAAVGVTSVAASHIMYRQGYDTPEDMALDVGSDLLVSTATGMIGGGASAQLMKYGNRAFFSMASLRNGSIIAADGALGMGAEYARQQLVLGKDASFMDMLKLGGPMVALGILLGAKTKMTRAEAEVHTRNLNDGIQFVDDTIESLQNELKRNDLSAEQRSLLQKQLGEYEKVREELREKIGLITIDRSKLQEDIPRENIQLKEIKVFQEISPQLISKAESELQQIIGNVRYNSFEKIDLFIQSYLAQKGKGVGMMESFQKLDLTDIDKLRGTNCVGMSLLLQKKLLELGIESHIIRFDAGGLINNAYVGNGHGALIIPRMINGEKHFTLMHPGLLISKGITFAEGKNSKIFQISGKQYIIRSDGGGELPYILEINSRQSLHFDPHHEWVNPRETLNKDIMRATGKFKLVRQNPDGKPQYAFVTDIQSEKIILKLGAQKIEISYQQFINIKNDREMYEVYREIIKQLGEDPENFYKRNIDIINNLEEYKQTIWAPSTREIINN